MEDFKDTIIEVGFAGAFLSGLSVLGVGVLFAGILAAIGEAIINIKEFFSFA